MDSLGLNYTIFSC